MTDNEALEQAREQLRAEYRAKHAEYMRKWRKENPEKNKALRERERINRLKREMEVKRNGKE